MHSRAQGWQVPKVAPELSSLTGGAAILTGGNEGARGFPALDLQTTPVSKLVGSCNLAVE